VVQGPLLYSPRPLCAFGDAPLPADPWRDLATLRFPPIPDGIWRRSASRRSLAGFGDAPLSADPSRDLATLRFPPIPRGIGDASGGRPLRSPPIAPAIPADPSRDWRQYGAFLAKTAARPTPIGDTVGPPRPVSRGTH